MCGIFGAVRNGKGDFSSKVLIRMAREQETRGRHAFGVAWVDESGRLCSYRTDDKITNHLDAIARLVKARAIIGHTRFTTCGSEKNVINNHPHPADGGWLVHNGMISNYEEMASKHDLLLSSQCDSEVIARLMETSEGTILARMVAAVDAVDQTDPLAVAGLWSRPARLVLVRRGNPLYVSANRKGNIYFASLARGLPGKAVSMRQNTAKLIRVAQQEEFVKAVKPYKEHFRVARGYAGGKWWRQANGIWTGYEDGVEYAATGPSPVDVNQGKMVLPPHPSTSQTPEKKPASLVCGGGSADLCRAKDRMRGRIKARDRRHDAAPKVVCTDGQVVDLSPDAISKVDQAMQLRYAEEYAAWHGEENDVKVAELMRSYGLTHQTARDIVDSFGEDAEQVVMEAMAGSEGR